MDDLRFDDLAKRVASPSRRQLLGGLLGGLAVTSVSGTLSFLGLEDGEAARKGKKAKPRSKPRRSKNRATKPHVKQQSGSRQQASAASELGNVGICHRTKSEAHPYEYIETGDPAVIAHHREHERDVIGVDLQTDPLNCGECGHACTVNDPCKVASCDKGTCTTNPVLCEGGRICEDGDCVCPAGMELCDRECVSNTCGAGERFDPESCRCVTDRCPFNQVRDPVSGRCGCPPGTTECRSADTLGGDLRGACFVHNCDAPGNGGFNAERGCECRTCGCSGIRHGFNDGFFAVSCCQDDPITGVCPNSYECRFADGTMVAGCGPTPPGCFGGL